MFKNDGAFVSMIEGREDPLGYPRGLAFTKDGHVYVTGWKNDYRKVHIQTCVKEETHDDTE